jgi:hypothetical protein
MSKSIKILRSRFIKILKEELNMIYEGYEDNVVDLFDDEDDVTDLTDDEDDVLDLTHDERRALLKMLGQREETSGRASAEQSDVRSMEDEIAELERRYLLNKTSNVTQLGDGEYGY